MTRWLTALVEELRQRVSNDSFWSREIDRLEDAQKPRTALHLAVFVEPYLQFVLDRRKTIESRFSCTRCAPYGSVRPGDVLLLKRSGGPVVGICQVTGVWYYELDPGSWSTIRSGFAEQLCISDPAFWSAKKHASYASLMRIEHARDFDPLPIAKRDRRGWVILSRHHEQQDLLDPYLPGVRGQRNFPAA